MQTLHWIILGFLAAAIIVVLKVILTKSDIGNYSCSIRPSFCSSERRNFWVSLQKAVGEDYTVLANVPLATLIEAEEESGPLQEWLQQHWADFAIVKDSSLSPTAVVQFERYDDDADSLWSAGQDETLKKVVDKAGLTLLYLPSDRYQHVELLRHAFEQARTQGEAAAELYEYIKGSETSG